MNNISTDASFASDSIANELLREALSVMDGMRHQIEQMRGMFDDEDNTIAGSVEDHDNIARKIREALGIQNVSAVPSEHLAEASDKDFVEKNNPFTSSQSLHREGLAAQLKARLMRIFPKVYMQRINPRCRSRISMPSTTILSGI